MSQSSANNPVPTLSALMETANASWRVFDLGRRVTSISKSEFASVENNDKPYPFPIQQKARFALVFWDQTGKVQDAMKNPFIWFLQFDLDELGLLKLQQRDHYISLVIKEMGSRLVEGGEQGELNNHPYSFTPDQNRQAAFNAMLKVALKQPASMYYEFTQSYFKAEVDADKWQQITVQGIADFAARLEHEENAAALIRSLPELPVQVLNTLAACLEHQTISLPLSQALATQLSVSLHENDMEKALNLLRCLSGSVAKPLVSEQLALCLDSELHESLDLFVVIAGRFWPYLNDQTLRYKFFELAAKHSNQQLFAGIFSDLAAVPDVRQSVIGLIRDVNRPDAVSRAIGAVFGHS